MTEGIVSCEAVTFMKTMTWFVCVPAQISS